MNKKYKILSIVGIGFIFNLGLSGCGILPGDTQYNYIDEALAEIDYTTIGDIVEVKEQGSGVAGPSYKTIIYKDGDSFEESKKRVKLLSEDCKNRNYSENLDCSYNGMNFRIKKKIIQLIL